MNRSILINFRAPRDLKASFDTVCACKNVTRTHVFNEFMRSFVLTTTSALLDEKKRLNEFNIFLSNSISNPTNNQSVRDIKSSLSPRDRINFDEENIPVAFFKDEDL
jgi:hypothetical protein